jgi:hypothetical protein
MKKIIFLSALVSLGLISCYRDATTTPSNTGNGSKDFNNNAQTDANAGDTSKRINGNPGNQTQQDSTKYSKGSQ